MAQLPPGNEKRYWQRYIYLWVRYALFEELEVGDAGRAREVYRAALKLIPHSCFTFAKVGCGGVGGVRRSQHFPVTVCTWAGLNY